MTWLRDLLEDWGLVPRPRTISVGLTAYGNNMGELTQSAHKAAEEFANGRRWNIVIWERARIKDPVVASPHSQAFALDFIMWVEVEKR